jgi:hypothetical protein
MCNPAILAVASIAATVVGGMMQAQGAANQAAAAQHAINMQNQAQAAQSAAQTKVDQGRYDYQATVERNNAQAARYIAEDEVHRGNVEEKQYRMQVAQLRGRQRSVLAASGVALDEAGTSAMDVLADTDYLAGSDVGVIRSNAKRRAYESRLRAADHEAQAGALDYGAAAAPVENYRTPAAYTGPSPGAAAAPALVGAAGSVASKWYGFKKEGVF